MVPGPGGGLGVSTWTRTGVSEGTWTRRGDRGLLPGPEGGAPRGFGAPTQGDTEEQSKQHYGLTESLILSTASTSCLHLHDNDTKRQSAQGRARGRARGSKVSNRLMLSGCLTKRESNELSVCLKSDNPGSEVLIGHFSAVTAS